MASDEAESKVFEAALGHFFSCRSDGRVLAEPESRVDSVGMLAAQLTAGVRDVVASLFRPDAGPDGVASVGDKSSRTVLGGFGGAGDLTNDVDADSFPPALWVTSASAQVPFVVSLDGLAQ